MFKILEIAIVSDGMHFDRLYLRTDLPQALPFPSPVKMNMEVASWKGEEYVKANFPGVPYTISG